MFTIADLLGRAALGGASAAGGAIFKNIWEQVTRKSIEGLYLESFQQAVSESRPYLEEKTRHGGIVGIEQADLQRSLHQELDISIDEVSISTLISDEFLNRLAQSMERASVLIIGGNNLSQADYLQITKKLISIAKNKFEELIISNEKTFREATLKELYESSRINRELQDKTNQILLLLANLQQSSEERARGEIYPKHNLPQYEYQFVGRNEQINEIHSRLLPKKQYHIIVIDGIGGVGKTTLALEVANLYLKNYDSLPFEERFHRIIWTSAKANRLEIDGIKKIYQTLRTLGDLYTDVSAVLGLEKPNGIDLREWRGLISQELRRQRTLIIVDNLETIADESIIEFLRELPSPTKVIVTTRERIDVSYPIPLEGMPLEEALILISQECNKADVPLSEADKVKLFERTGGVPLAIVWSIGKMRYGQSIEEVLAELGNCLGDISRFCFEESLKSIQGDAAYTTLIALAQFDEDACRRDVGYVSGLENDMMSRNNALQKLETLSLVKRQPRLEQFDPEFDLFCLLPLTRGFIISHTEQNIQSRDIVEITKARRRDLLDYRLKLSREAAHWLEDHQISLIEEVRISILEKNNPNPEQFSREVMDNFYKSVSDYLAWAIYTLAYPDLLLSVKDTGIPLVLPQDKYISALESIKFSIGEKYNLSLAIKTDLKSKLDELIEFFRIG